MPRQQLLLWSQRNGHAAGSPCPKQTFTQKRPKAWKGAGPLMFQSIFKFLGERRQPRPRPRRSRQGRGALMLHSSCGAGESPGLAHAPPDRAKKGFKGAGRGLTPVHQCIESRNPRHTRPVARAATKGDLRRFWLWRASIGRCQHGPKPTNIRLGIMQKSFHL